MFTVMSMRDVACETCQWRPVPYAAGGMRVTSMVEFRTERKLQAVRLILSVE
jgi:hypothetical protein